MVHYIPLAKDFSNLDEVLGRVRDADLRRELTENAHRDLIASGRYSLRALRAGGGLDSGDAGVGPLRERAAAEEAIRRGERLRRGRTQMRYVVNGVMSTPPGRRLRETADPVTVRVRRRLGRPRPEQIKT